MFNDILAVLWKEWRELTRQRGARSGLSNWLMLVAPAGILMPLQAGAAWVNQPLVPLLWAWLPVLAVMWIMADSIAGERERHTLETLLSSRLSDQAILLGKILAGVIYGWSIEVCSLLLAALTVNVRSPRAGFYPWPWFLSLLGLSLLALLLTCATGALASLHASTVRGAYQRLSLAILGIGLAGCVGFKCLPEEARHQMMLAFSKGHIDLESVGWGALVLLAAGAVSILLAFKRFCRRQLVLD